MIVEKLARGVFALTLAVAAGCSLFRWSGNYVQRERRLANSSPMTVLDPYALPASEDEEEAFRLRPSSGPVLPEAFTEAELNALYYYDLGSAEMDVSRYPEKQRKNYQVFRQVCSRCHTLARPINSPRSDRWAWDFYVFTMRMRGQFDSEKAFTKEEAEQIVDFLTYDSGVRKGKNRAAFEVQSRRLQLRFDKKIDAKLRMMQQGRPLLRPE